MARGELWARMAGEPELKYEGDVAPAGALRGAAMLPRGTRTRRVLIADSDQWVCASLGAVLESEGYTTFEATTGLAAIRTAMEHAPDLVLLDLNLPEMDGWAAFSRLGEVRPELPVIIITARPNQYRQAAHLGVDAFMEKPLDIPLLLSAIDDLTKEATRRNAQVTPFVTRKLNRG
jgi:CheY-like chemotaxis protein